MPVTAIPGYVCQPKTANAVSGSTVALDTVSAHVGEQQSGASVLILGDDKCQLPSSRLLKLIALLECAA